MFHNLAFFKPLVTSAPLILGSQFAFAAEQSQLQSASPADSVLPMLGGLLAILGLIFLLAVVFKKFSGFNLATSHIKVIESQNLGAKEKLVVVEVQGKQLLLGVTPHNINHLCELETAIEKAPTKMPFESIMKQLLNPQQMAKDLQSGRTKKSSPNSSEEVR